MIPAVSRLMLVAFAHGVLATGLPVFAQEEDLLAPPWQTVESGVRMSTSAGSHFSREGRSVKMDEGTLLLEADQPTTIQTPLSTLQVRAKSVVYIKVHHGNEHFFVLLGPAELKTGKHSAPLSSGEEAILLDHEPAYSDLVGQDDIGRRRIRVNKLSESESLALSEFSLIQAVEREPMLYRLVHSTDAHDKSVRERLIKMAAVLNIVTGRHGQYSTGVH